MSHSYMTEQAPGSGDNHICTHLESLCLNVETASVVAPIDCNTGNAVQIVAKTLHGLVYLLCQLTCGSHDDTIDSILRISAVIKHGKYGQ